MKCALLSLLLLLAAVTACEAPSVTTAARTSGDLIATQQDALALVAAIRTLGMDDQTVAEIPQAQLRFIDGLEAEATTRFTPLGIEIDVPSGAGHESTRLLAHELCHLVLGRPDRMGRPWWLDEGLCEFVSFRSTNGLRELLSLLAAVASRDSIQVVVKNRTGDTVESIALPERIYRFPDGLRMRIQLRYPEIAHAARLSIREIRPVDYVYCTLALIEILEGSDARATPWSSSPHDLVALCGDLPNDGLPPEIDLTSDTQLARITGIAEAYTRLMYGPDTGMAVTLLVDGEAFIHDDGARRGQLFAQSSIEHGIRELSTVDPSAD